MNFVILHAAGEKVEMQDISEDDFYSKFYQPNSTSLQFAFQGANIFRGAIQDLLNSSDLGQAEEVILAGSSAGTNIFKGIAGRVSTVNHSLFKYMTDWMSIDCIYT